MLKSAGIVFVTLLGWGMFFQEAAADRVALAENAAEDDALPAGGLARAAELRRDLANESRKPDPDVLRIAGLYRALAQMETGLGAYQQASEDCRSCVAIYEAYLPEADPLLTETLIEAGQCLIELGQWGEAESCLHQAWLNSQQQGAEGLETLAAVAGILGDLFVASGQLPRAEEFLLQAQTLAEQLWQPDRSERAKIADSLGRYYLAVGRPQAAETLYATCLAAALSPEYQVKLRSQFAIACGRQGRTEDGLRALGQAQESADSGGRALLAEALIGRARYSLEQNDLDEALAKAQVALAFRTAEYGGNHPAVAEAACLMAEIAQGRERADQAEYFYRYALRIYERSHGATSRRAGAIGVRLAAAVAAQGNVEVARRIYSQALEVFLRLDGMNSPDVAYIRDQMALLEKNVTETGD